VATTAVPAHVFSSGLPVARQVVRLSPQQLEHAQVIPHPGVNPTMRAVLAGAPVRPPSVRPQSLVTAARTAPRAAPVSQRSLGVAQPRMAPPRLLTRTPPPPARVPFAIERPAMMARPAAGASTTPKSTRGTNGWAYVGSGISAARGSHAESSNRSTSAVVRESPAAA
jgi:hypothetical protein